MAAAGDPMTSRTTRRAFLTLCGAAAIASMPLSSLAESAVPKLDPKDPAAKALGYVDNAAQLKPGQEANYKLGNHCGSCALYSKSQEKSGYAPCAAFPGKSVANKGWCRAYAA